MSARRLLPVAALLLLLLASALAAGPAGPAPARAQAPAEPDLVATLYGNTVRIRTVPLTAVTAELSNDDGPKDQGAGVAGPDGLADIFFFVQNAAILPGDTLSFSRQGERPLRIKVPTLTVGVDLAADRIVGTAPPSAPLTVAYRVGDAAPVERPVTAAADGAFALDLAGAVDLAPGAMTGTVTYDGPENRRFEARFAALSAQLTIGAMSFRGLATPGTRVRALVRRSGGTEQDLGGARVQGDGSFEYWVVGPDSGPLASGDLVTVRQEGGPPGTDQEVSASLADLAVELNPQTDRILGLGPAATRLRLVADDMDGGSARFETTSDAAGAFAVSTAGQADLGPGWRVRAAYEAAPGVEVGALAVLRKVRIGVRIPLGEGRAEPGRALTVTLRDATGAVKQQQPSWVDDQGQYTLFFGSPFNFDEAPVSPEPGDSVELAFEAGDPALFMVPKLSAVPDVAADTVSGEAPGGTDLVVQVSSAPGSPRVAASADASGRYSARLAGTVDLARPANGRVSFTDGLAEFYTSWAAVQVTAAVGNSFGSNYVIGNGPSWRQVKAELFGPDGRLVGDGRSTVFGDGIVIVTAGGGAFTPQFFLTLADITGVPVEMKPGDRLRITAGDSVTELLVPPLDAVVFVQTDTVNGHTTASGRVTIQVVGDPTGGISATADVMADANGNFSHSFAGAWDIKYGDYVQLQTGIDGHTIVNTTIAPGLLLELDQAILLGSVAPNAEASIALRRGGRVLSQTRATADESGGLATQFTDDAGEPLVLLAQDEVSVTPLDAGADPMTLTVPELSVVTDVGTDAIGGRASAGGSLALIATEAYPRAGSLGLAQAWPAVSEASTYAADFVPSVDVRPGTRVIALYRPPAGHYVVRTRTVPILNAEHSGPNACGFGEPRLPVTAQLLAAGGASLASAQSRARMDGFFSTVLRDAASAAVATAAGQTERALLGTTDAELALPTLDLTVDWQSGMVQGSGPADTPFFLLPATPCPAQAPGGVLNISIGFGFEQRTGPDGSFRTFSPPDLRQPGRGLELAVYAPGDHRIFRHVYRTLGQVFVSTDRVAGRSNPLEAVTVSLKGADGRERARAAGKADAGGWFDLRLLGAGGQPAASAAGDVVVLEVSTEAPAVTVEPLTFDWSPGGTALVGQAPAARPVVLTFRLADGRRYAVTRETDAGGSFRFAGADVPPRATWSWTDVVAIRATLETPNGHQIVYQTEDFEAGPPPAPDGRTVYLPILYTGRVSRAANAVLARPLSAAEARDRAFGWLALRLTRGARGEDPAVWAPGRRPDHHSPLPRR